ncbi:O-antigen ligase family protein [Sinomonas susongensis]|uniref:O-antigen ligase family protein n=1 Tax=Sinomonas susongensis TaxID=1324851 RepID=UPI001108C5B9|nr:O-antigen ligase family protein [Sinomonas susongensis]
MSRFSRILSQGPDAKTVLTIFLALCLVPSYLTFTVIGTVGRPATLLALGLFAWWLADKLRRHVAVPWPFQPVRWALAAVVIAVLASYAGAMFRGLPGAEISPADTGLLLVAAWCGLCLVTHDGLRTMDDVIIMVRRIVTTGALMAALGLAQFITKTSLLAWISIPGMSGDTAGAIDQRGGFVRAAGTASHPLEYGLVLCAILPLALALALEDRERGVLARWWPAAVIGTAAVLSVSRSALIAAVVAIAVLFVSWSPRVRAAASLIGCGILGLVYVSVPGFAGTLLGMFTGAAGDPSVSSRLNSYDVAFGMASRSPILGRGFGTLLPSYVYLDNEYLGVIVELGLVGLAAVLWFFATGIVCAWGSSRRARTPFQQQLGSAIAAALCASAVSFTFFDALSFPLSAAFTFMLLGLAGAYHRVSSASRGLFVGLDIRPSRDRLEPLLTV